MSEADNSSKEPSTPENKPKLPEPPNWFELAKSKSEEEIQQAFSEFATSIIRATSQWIPNMSWLALMDSEGSINSHTATIIHETLTENNRDKNTDIALIILSRGGRIEPAYQIAKICKSHSKSRFLTIVPRFAKSAATLVAIGADEIHIGPLGELGPIDPQINGLPALGVLQALENIAEISEKYPGSAEMLAAYLQKVISVEQVGYCQRSGQSAVQYAERLLSLKGSRLAEAAADIAQKLVYEYKDHGFVIDAEEAAGKLGSEWIKADTSELVFAEYILRHYERLNFWLKASQQKRVVVLGNFTDGVIVVS